MLVDLGQQVMSAAKEGSPVKRGFISHHLFPIMLSFNIDFLESVYSYNLFEEFSFIC